MAIATIASQQAITASPVAAATAAMIGLFSSQQLAFGLPQILAICVPSTLIGVLVSALVQTRVGKELADDPEYQRASPPAKSRRRARRRPSASRHSFPRPRWPAR